MRVHLTPEAAVQSVCSGQRVFVHGGAAVPLPLLQALVERAHELPNLEFIHLHLEAPALHAIAPFRIANLFVGASMRPVLDYDRVDYLPCFLSEMPALLRNRRRPDVALIHVSPPDEHGVCSLGVSVDIARAAVDTAETVIALINPKMPRVGGDGLISIEKITDAVEMEIDLPVVATKALSESNLMIGRHVASLIDDGATLQTGIGAIPNAVLTFLSDRKDLGVHSEMWSDGMVDLIEKGVVTNRAKKVYVGKSVSAFLMGSERLYRFVHNNPSVLQLGADVVNCVRTIAQNPQVIAINSAVEVDLTGQVCADSLGPQIISGVGGQLDFLRGAALSDRGKPIIAMKSRTKSGQPKIVSMLKPGSGVVTTRSHVHYVVTEYGVADLAGKTLSEIARALIAIAHPEDREGLQRQWWETRRKTGTAPEIG